MRKKSRNKIRVLITIMALIMSVNGFAGIKGVSAAQLSPNIQLESLQEGQVVSGQLELEGWSINETGIKEVNIYNEEQLLGKAEIGILTPQIQEKYPDYIGSEQSGFTYSLDTTKLEDGVHNLIIKSVGNDDIVDELQINIDVQNVTKENTNDTKIALSASDTVSTQVALESKIYIDAPINNSKISSQEVLVRGWALNGSGIKEVNILVDGNKVGSATIDLDRPDVDKAYPGYIGGDTSGYEYLLDTSKIKPGGLITVQAVGINETIQTSSVTITKATPLMSIDEPVTNFTMKKQEVLVRGWAVNGSGIKEVNILVNGQKVGSATIGKERLDVDKAFPGYIGGKTSGYEYILDTSKVTPGGLITVQAVGTDGTSQTSNISITKPVSIMSIDEPINNTTINKQEVLVRGWAVNGSGIKEVNILVNGQKVGSATIGNDRLDVDKAFPGYIGGKTSGYEYTLDTSKISPGTPIVVQAVGTDGTSQTSSVTITKRTPIMSIDEPTMNQTISGEEVLVRGWAVNGSGIKEVNILVNGQKVGSATIGKERLDVDKAFPGYIGGKTSGYEYLLDTSTISPGTPIVVQAVGTDGTSQTSSVSITKRAAITNIDGPTNNQNISAQEVQVRGWALNASGIKEVNILVAGQKVGSATIGISRPDVNSAYPGYTGGDISGYEYTLNISAIKPGTPITVQAIGKDGSIHTSTSISITKPAPKIFIDTLINSQTINSQPLLIQGWALNSSGVKEVNILVNGQKVGNATIGLSRTDVNNVHPGYRDGDKSGFQYSLNTSVVGSGNNVITIQAIGNDGTVIESSSTVNRNSLSGKTVMLDPGHGGSDPGAVNGSIYEKNLNNAIVRLVAEKLTALGANVIYTRNPNTDVYLSLNQRAAIANQSMPDLFISVHHDASYVTGYSIHYSSYRPNLETFGAYFKDNKGVTYQVIREENGNVYYMDGGVQKVSSINSLGYVIYDSTPSSAATNSSTFANLLYNSMKELTFIGPRNNPVSDHNLAVTRLTNMPSILIEVGPTNATSANASNQNAAATKMVDAIKNYFK